MCSSPLTHGWFGRSNMV
ncbi:predicted protein [Fibroporia radiculosa]|uniref:Uncharacterized protein n=1 Tax=Fibroporia radiculosa TaxID=599839 RepID=J7SCH0_9APHY|nr:predicted protein [Fibroporia radiculosa]